MFLRSVSCAVRRRTTKFEAIPMSSSRPRIGVNLSISSRTGRMLLCPLAWPNPDLRRPMMLMRIRRHSPTSNSGLVSANQVRSPLIVSRAPPLSRGIPLAFLVVAQDAGKQKADDEDRPADAARQQRVQLEKF